jgi:hypothetical protein
MSPALINFLATGNLLGIGCGSSSAHAEGRLGLADSVDCVRVRDGIELRRIYGEGALTIIIEQEAVAAIGLYWGSNNIPPVALRNAGIATQTDIPLQEFEGVLKEVRLSFERYEEGRILLIRDSGVVAFTDRRYVGSLVKPCVGSLFLDELISLEPALNGAFAR